MNKSFQEVQKQLQSCNQCFVHLDKVRNVCNDLGWSKVYKRLTDINNNLQSNLEEVSFIVSTNFNNSDKWKNALTVFLKEIKPFLKELEEIQELFEYAGLSKLAGLVYSIFALLGFIISNIEKEIENVRI